MYFPGAGWRAIVISLIYFLLMVLTHTMNLVLYQMLICWGGHIEKEERKEEMLISS